MKNINAILACDINFGIGNEGNLPWPKNKRDMAWFQKHTKNQIVLMGRTTWESLGSKPLPNRFNIVVTSQNLKGPDLTAHGNFEDILNAVRKKFPGKTIWVMGGADIYRQALPFCDRLYLTIVNLHCQCDKYVESDIITKFPVIEHWQEDKELTFQIRKR